MFGCQHRNVSANVVIHQLANARPGEFLVEVQIRCADCDEWFKFVNPPAHPGLDERVGMVVSSHHLTDADRDKVDTQLIRLCDARACAALIQSTHSPESVPRASGQTRALTLKQEAK